MVDDETEYVDIMEEILDHLVNVCEPPDLGKHRVGKARLDHLLLCCAACDLSLVWTKRLKEVGGQEKKFICGQEKKLRCGQEKGMKGIDQPGRWRPTCFSLW